MFQVMYIFCLKYNQPITLIGLKCIIRSDLLYVRGRDSECDRLIDFINRYRKE